MITALLPFTKYAKVGAYALVFLTIAGLLVQARWLRSDIAKRDDSIATLQDELSLARAANKSNGLAIQGLSDANQSWADQAERDASVIADMRNAALSLSREVTASRTELKRLQQEDISNDTLKLLDIDLVIGLPGFVQRLRNQQATLDSHRDDYGQGAGRATGAASRIDLPLFAGVETTGSWATDTGQRAALGGGVGADPGSLQQEAVQHSIQPEGEPIT